MDRAATRRLAGIGESELLQGTDTQVVPHPDGSDASFQTPRLLSANLELACVQRSLININGSGQLSGEAQGFNLRQSPVMISRFIFVSGKVVVSKYSAPLRLKLRTVASI